MEIALIVLIIAVIVLAAKLTAAHGKIAEAERKIEEYNEFIACGAIEYEYKQEPLNTISIYAKGLHGYKILIGNYRSDDQAYAIRCAEELIEKLEEKI